MVEVDWIPVFDSQIVYEIDHRKLVLYVIPEEHILGKVPENVLLCQLVTQERFRTTCATCFQAHLATASRVLAMDAGSGLSTRGQWRGPATCNEWEGGFGQCQPPYTTLMCRFVPTFIMTFMAIIAIMCQKN